MALENRAEGQALPGDSGQDALFWSVLGHSVSTSASFVVHGPETAPDAVLPLSVSPSSAPKEDKKKGHVRSGQPELRNPTPKDQRYLSLTFSSSVKRSFFSFSLSTAFSSQRRAFALRSLAPPEITPDFWKRVPSSATVYKQQGEKRQRRW